MSMSLINYSPFLDVDRLFGRNGFLGTGRNLRTAWLPPVDISETDEAYLIDVELPAVAKDDISVTVKDGVLTVRGERKSEDLAEGRRHRVERRFGEFSRSFHLPEEVEEGGIAATAEQGVLRVTARKRAPAVPRSINVEVR